MTPRPAAEDHGTALTGVRDADAAVQGVLDVSGMYSARCAISVCRYVCDASLTREVTDTDLLSNAKALMTTVKGSLPACSPAMRDAVASRIEALARTRELRGSRVTARRQSETTRVHAPLLLL